MFKKCPGLTTRLLKVKLVKCPNCNYETEMFSDEIKISCPRCKTELYQEKLPSCIEWCTYARECIGEKRWEEIKQQLKNLKPQDSYREKILWEMRKYFGTDGKRIYHAERVLRFAELLLNDEKGDPRIVIPAAILHDIGIKECERKYNSTNGQLQEKEGPPIARRIMERLGIKEEIINEVCQIIACHHSPGELDTLNFKILYDADWLVNFREYPSKIDKKLIDKVMLTAKGRELAYQLYLT